MATSYRIHPAIGIARLGNSPEIFIGPENVGQAPPEKLKPDFGKIKRQAARFSIFEIDTETGKTIRELKHDGASVQIVWTVHLANRKAAYGDRNAQITDRRRLVIEGGLESISGKEAGASELAGSFQGHGVQPERVVLGQLRTDEQGRLIVAGGTGRSFSPTGAGVQSFKDNDDWCDDASDGPVRAFIQLDKGEWVEAESAWVVVAPPDFAPPVRDAVSLYDLMYQRALDKFGRHYDPLRAAGKVSFRHHVYPLLEAVALEGWVTQGAKGEGYLDPDVFPKLKSNKPEHKTDREKVFNELMGAAMDPKDFEAAVAGLDQEALEPGAVPASVAGFIPWMKWQTEVLTLWKDGDFAADFENPLPQEPWLARDKAALTACVGNSFIPGIEVSGIVQSSSLYRAPFRIDLASPGVGGRPGSLTQALGVPWQADYHICTIWPAQRPVRVKRDQKSADWVEGARTKEDMTAKWRWMGFVVSEKEEAPPECVEVERDLC